jgi:hypothetical protein
MMPVYTLTWTETQMWQAQVEAGSVEEAERLFGEGRIDGDRCVDALFGDDLAIREV